MFLINGGLVWFHVYFARLFKIFIHVRDITVFVQGFCVYLEPDSTICKLYDPPENPYPFQIMNNMESKVIYVLEKLNTFSMCLL